MPDCWVEFPLDQPLEGDAVEIASPFNFPPEGAYALFWFTNETFTQVLSALWNGAILTYPEQAYQVIWYFLQNVEVPVQLCEQVALCFANDEEFRQSVVNSLSIDPSFTQVINNISTTCTPMTQPQIEAVVGDNCDEDVLFGGIVVLIDQMNTNNLDFMQVFEVATNLVERASALVAAIPIFETLPFDDLIEFVDRFFNEIYENYEAEVTTSLLNEYKCDLFCIALENEGCGFTYETLYNYFKARVDGAFTIDSLFQVVIEALASGSYSGSLIADFMYMLQIQVMRSASNFLGVNVLALQTSYNIGALTPDHSWALIPCDCAPPPPSDLWVITTCIGETRYGIIDKISGPTSGPGTYEFKFTGVQFDPPTSIFIGGFRWGNTSEQFVVNAISSNVTFPAAGTGYYFPPASDADCGYEPGLVATLPVADGTTPYGGIKANTYNTDPWEITMNITVSAI